MSEVVWVGDTEDSILYLNSTNAEITGGVTLYTADLGSDLFEPYVMSMSWDGSGTNEV